MSEAMIQIFIIVFFNISVSSCTYCVDPNTREKCEINLEKNAKFCTIFLQLTFENKQRENLSQDINSFKFLNTKIKKIKRKICQQCIRYRNRLGPSYWVFQKS